MARITLTITDSRFAGTDMTEAEVREIVAGMIADDNYPLRDPYVSVEVPSEIAAGQLIPTRTGAFVQGGIIDDIRRDADANAPAAFVDQFEITQFGFTAVRKFGAAAECGHRSIPSLFPGLFKSDSPTTIKP